MDVIGFFAMYWFPWVAMVLMALTQMGFERQLKRLEKDVNDHAAAIITVAKHSGWEPSK